MSNKKTKVVLALTTLAMSVALSACGHEHEWKEATCTTPKTCVTCEETEGEALGHEWEEATCTTGKVCSTCGETKGEALGHKWEEATCTTAKKCSVCGETEGDKLDHEWKEATCTTPKTCNMCSATEGEVLEHDLDSKGKCTLCKEQIGFALNSSNYKNYLSVKLSSEKGQHGYVVNCMVEPLKNVTFHNVVITFGYTAKNSKYKEMNGYVELAAGTNKEGYGTNSYYTDTNKTSGTVPSNLKFVNISGYIIE